MLSVRRRAVLDAGVEILGQSRHIRNLLKRKLIPLLEAESFQGKYPEFQRLEDGCLQLLAINFDQYDRGFFLELATHSPGDLVTSWGEVVPEREITVAHTPVESRARLQRRGHRNSLSEDWFLYEGLSADEVEELVDHVVDLLPQMDDFFHERKVGGNISIAGA